MGEQKNNGTLTFRVAKCESKIEFVNGKGRNILILPQSLFLSRHSSRMTAEQNYHSQFQKDGLQLVALNKAVEYRERSCARVEGSAAVPTRARGSYPKPRVPDLPGLENDDVDKSSRGGKVKHDKCTCAFDGIKLMAAARAIKLIILGDIFSSSSKKGFILEGMKAEINGEVFLVYNQGF